MSDKKYDLEDRLVDFTCRMIDVVKAFPLPKAIRESPIVQKMKIEH